MTRQGCSVRGGPSSHHTVSRVGTKLLSLYKRCEIHSKIPKGSAAGRNGKGHLSLRELVPASIWSMKMHRTTTPVEKSIPRARHMHSHGISTSMMELKAFKTSAWAVLLGQRHLHALTCRWALLGANLSAGGILQEARMRHKNQARERREQPPCPALGPSRTTRRSQAACIA